VKEATRRWPNIFLHVYLKSCDKTKSGLHTCSRRCTIFLRKNTHTHSILWSIQNSHEIVTYVHLKKSSTFINAMESSMEKILCMLKSANHPWLLLLWINNESSANNLFSTTHAWSNIIANWKQTNISFSLLFYLWHTPTFLEIFKCESKSGNNEKRNWGTLLTRNISRVKGCAQTPGCKL
jgi:hypothetical protein